MVTERVQVMATRPGTGAEQSLGGTVAGEEEVLDAFHVRHVQRWRIGTPYTAVIEDVAALMRTPRAAQGTLLRLRPHWRGRRRRRPGRQASGAPARMGDCFAPLGVTFTAGFCQRGAAQGFYEP